MFVEDLTLFTADFGVPVVLGAGPTRTECQGLADVVDAHALGDDGRAEVLVRLRTVLVPTAAVDAAGLAVGDRLTVAGAAATARDVQAEGDGAFTRIAYRTGGGA